MFGYLRNLLSGKSGDHFVNAANHTKNASVAAVNAVKDLTTGTANLAGVGVDAGVGYQLFKTASGEIMGANAGLQFTDQLNKFVGNTSFEAKAVAAAAYVTKEACKVLVNHPTPVLAGTVLAYLALHPDYTIAAGKNFSSAAVNAAKIGINLTGAAAETTAGTALRVKEGVEDWNYYLGGRFYDRQDGFGTDGHYFHKYIGPFEEETTSLDGSVFSDDWVDITGVPSLIVNEEL